MFLVNKENHWKNFIFAQIRPQKSFTDPDSCVVNSIDNVLIIAARGSSNILKIILEQNVDINDQNILGITAFMYAVMGDYQENVEILLKAVADTGIKDNEGK